MKHKLLTTQKNSVFERLQAADMNPADFEWAESTFSTNGMGGYGAGGGGMYKQALNECPKLVLKKHPQFFFQFEVARSQHSYTCSPGADHFEESGHPGFWGSQLDAVSDWAIRLKKEIVSPDLWSDLNRYQIPISPDVADDGLNEVISASEAEIISEKLEILGDEIKKVYNLSSEQDRFVRDKLNYLAEAAKRSRTKDWVFMAIAIFQTIMMGLTLTPEQQLQMIEIIKNTFKGFMNLIG